MESARLARSADESGVGLPSANCSEATPTATGREVALWRHPDPRTAHPAPSNKIPAARIRTAVVLSLRRSTLTRSSDVRSVLALNCFAQISGEMAIARDSWRRVDARP